MDCIWNSCIPESVDSEAFKKALKYLKAEEYPKEEEGKEAEPEGDDYEGECQSNGSVISGRSRGSQGHLGKGSSSKKILWAIIDSETKHMLTQIIQREEMASGPPPRKLWGEV